MKTIERYAVLLVLMFLAGTLFFYRAMQENIEMIEREALQNTRQRFDASQSAFDKLSQNFYNNYNDYLARMLRLAQNGEEREVLRNELLDRLYPPYHNATFFGLNQFQLFDREGRSFLRFHYSDYRDDDLQTVRPSIRRLLREKRFLKGFEIGRFVDGLRYLYPLFHDGKFVGGFEWVWNHEALIREMRRIYGGRYGIIVQRSGMAHTVLPREIQKRYAPFRSCGKYLYHRSAFRIYGKRFASFVDRIFLEKELCRKLDGKHSFIFEKSVDGKEYLVVAHALRSLSGEPYGYFLSIEEDDRIARAVRLFVVETAALFLLLLLIYLLLYRSWRNEIFVRTLLDSQKDIVILTDGKRLSDANRTFFDFFDVRSVEEFIRSYGCISNLFIEAEGYLGREYDGKTWLEALREREEESRLIMFDRKRGEERVFMTSLNRFDHTGLYVISFRDITELEREKRHFKIESMMDHLTGLYNKRSFEYYLRDRLADMRKYGRDGFVLLMFDIDHFKRINDRYGHRKGDEVLCHLAAKVQSMMRKSDFLARWGGEEFMIVMEGSDLEGACRKAELLRDAIEHEDFGISESVTCSFGVTALRPDDTIESALERVDRLLYRAKHAGRNRVVCEGDPED